MKFLNLLPRVLPGAHRPSGFGDASLHGLLGLAWVVEARDPYTGGHLWRVSRYAGLLAERAGLPAADIARVTVGGFLHDLGKIAIPDAILRKTDRLTDSEYETVKTHPEVGRSLVARHPFGGSVIDAIYAHHERPDGKGYPLGLTGDQIPAAPAIVGICDAFDAMTSARPYRKPMPVETALSVLRENLGGQFHRHYGELFLALGDTADVQHIVGHSDDGIPLQQCITCGPTIVTRRGTAAGAQVFCPACTTGYRFEGAGRPLARTEARPTAQDLAPQPDEALIDRVLEPLARA